MYLPSKEIPLDPDVLPEAGQHMKCSKLALLLGRSSRQ